MFNNLIFDLDDNLFDYTNAYNKSINKVFEHLNEILNIDINILKNKFNIIKKKFHNNTKNQAVSHNKFIQLKKFVEFLNLSYKNLLDIHKLYLTEYFKNLKLFDNVINFLNLCKKSNINCFILTNNLCKEQINIIYELNIINYFKKIYTSEEFGCEKPDPKIFYSILVENNININDVAMIGDSYKNDIEGVNLINIYAFWYNKNDLNFKFNNNYCYFNCYTNIISFFNSYNLEVEEFIKLSKFCGERFDLVQAGGGNISFKLNEFMFIKSSGCYLSDIEINKNYVGVNYKEILINIFNINNNDKKCRENQSTNIVNNSIYFLKNFKPSIETTMHSLTKKYTVHLHPLQFLKICGKKNCLEILNNNFNNFCYIEYYTPGIDVALKLNKKYNNEDIIFMKNHGIVITNDSIDRIYSLIEITINKLEKIINFNFDNYKFTNYLSELMNEFTSNFTFSYLINDKIIHKLYNDNVNLKPFFPDKLVYCGIDKINLIKNKKHDFNEIKIYTEKYHEIPKIFLYENNIYINSNSLKKCIEIESLFKSHLICYDKDNDILDNNEINYLNNWDAEKYRKNL